MVILLLAPVLLVRPPLRPLFLDRINEALPGMVQVRSCSLGWMQGLECAEVSYSHPDQGIRMAAPRLTTDKGLLALLLAPGYLGAITLHQPVFSLSAKPGTSGAADGSLPISSGKAPAEDVTALGPQPWWERYSLRLRMEQATVHLDGVGADRREMARELNLQGSLASGTVHYDLGFVSGMELGRLQAKGFVNLPTTRLSLAEALISKTEVTITGLELAPFLAFAASRWSAPKGTGRFDAKVELVTAGLEEVKMHGEAALAHLKLAGGFLGQDEPSLAGATLRFSGSRGRKEGWRFPQLHLESEPLKLKGQGQVDNGSVTLDAEGMIHLPTLTAQLPHFFRLPEQTRIKEGDVNFSFHANGTPTEIQARADCRVATFSTTHNDQVYVWNAPLTTTMAADSRQGRVTVHEFNLKTPFLEASGRGAFDELTFQVEADLDQMSVELAKLFPLAYTGKGKLKLTGVSKQEEGVGFRLNGRIDVQGLALANGAVPLLPSHQFTLTGQAVGPAALFHDGRLAEARLEASSWPGTLTLALRAAETEKTKPLSRDFDAGGKLDLNRIGSILRGLDRAILPNGLTGMLSFAGKGQWQAPRLTLTSFEGQAENLRLPSKDKPLPLPRLAFALEEGGLTKRGTVTVRELVVADGWNELASDGASALVRADWQQRTLDARHLILRLEGVAAEAGLLLQDWRHPWRTTRAEFIADGQIAPLVALLTAANVLPQDIAAAGATQARVLFSALPEQERQRADVDLRLADAKVDRAGNTVFTSRNLQFKTTLEGDFRTNDTVSVSSFSLRTPALQAEGQGEIKRDAAHDLALTGTLTPDFTHLGERLTAAVGQQVGLTGRNPSDFRFSLALHAPIDLKQARLATTLRPDSAHFRGMQLRNLEIPVEMGKGRIDAVVNHELYGGRVSLKPQWRFAGPLPGLHLPDGSQALKGADVQSPLADGLLSRLHPLFGGLAKVEGTVDLVADRFAWSFPRGKARQPLFGVTIITEAVRFQPVGALASLLAQFGLEPKELLLEADAIRSEGRDGRVTSEPIRLRCGETRMTLQGATGMDGSLAYRLRLPVTEHLIGKERFAQLAGQSVEVPIVGTLAAPRVDREGFKQALALLLRQKGGAKEVPPTGTPAETVLEQPAPAR